MNQGKYKLSFTAASLSLSESLKIAEVFLGCKEWEETKTIVSENNLLQSRTSARTSRSYNELSQRLQTLSVEQLELLVDGNLEEQKYLLWFSICNLYLFIQEFAIEVIREKFLSMDYELTDFDYDSFFNRKISTSVSALIEAVRGMSQISARSPMTSFCEQVRM